MRLITSGAALSSRGCRAVSTSSTSCLTSSDTILDLQSETDDTDGYHSTTINTSRLTIPSGLGGRYIILGQIRFAPSTSGQRYCRLYINGVGDDYGTTMQGISTIGSHVNLGVIKNLISGDYIQIAGWQNSPGSININGFLSAYLLG